jgi:CheY-like chemotaxis protein
MKKVVNILLVEDEVITAMLMQSQLISLGYTVAEHVTTGENAVASAKENPPDIILMDIALAGEIDGIDAAAAIKSVSDIPVIFITGYEDQQYKERAEKIKPLEYLIKPLNMNKLKAIIDDFFK